MLKMTSAFKGINHATLYSKYRPKASPLIINKMLEFVKEKKTFSFEFAVDVACGSGQSTDVLGEHFKSVLGTDISESQVNQAKKTNTLPNIKYCVADALHLPLQDNSVDLVTCSQAAHWLDLPAFCKEVDRVLKPSGCLAIYARLRFNQVFLHEDKTIASELTQVFMDFLLKTLKDYWLYPVSRHGAIYKEDLQVTYRDSKRHIIEEHSDISIVGLINYLESFSAYQNFHREKPDHDDILQDLQDKMLNILGAVDKSPEDVIIKSMCPIFLLVGRKPSTHGEDMSC